MKTTHVPLPPIPGTCFAAVLAGMLCFSPHQKAWADDAAPATPAETNAVAAKASTPAKQPSAKKQITGAELYSIHCNRCHQERYPTERTGAQWRTIMLHMQIRANIPPTQARLILQYLQENSGR